jgi:hypothetical protein
MNLNYKISNDWQILVSSDEKIFSVHFWHEAFEYVPARHFIHSKELSFEYLTISHSKHIVSHSWEKVLASYFFHSLSNKK